MSTSARRYMILLSYNIITANNSISIYASAPFKFIIEGTPLYIHAALVTQVSKPLDRMINGYMSEAQEGFAEIKEVDEGTFVRFIQWAYNGEYEPGEFKIDDSCIDQVPDGAEVPPEEVPDEEEAVMQDAPGGNSGAVPFFAQQPKQGMRDAFYGWQLPAHQETINSSAPRMNSGPEEDYTNVFLSHARVFVFAEKFDIQPLKALALDRLHGTLHSFWLYPECTGDIIALLKYVYANTGEPMDGVKDLRSLLKLYMACSKYTLMEDQGFRDLLIEDGGPILGDFFDMVKQSTMDEAHPQLQNDVSNDMESEDEVE